MSDAEIKTGADVVREARRRIKAMDDAQLDQAVRAVEARDHEAPSPCRCPLRPYGHSFVSGSAWETARLREWSAEHGDHPYAKARDELAMALQYAEGAVKREEQGKAGEAVLDMVHDVIGLLRRGASTRPLEAHACEEECCLPK